MARPVLDLECDLGLWVVEHHGNIGYYLRLHTQEQRQRAVDSWMEWVLGGGEGHINNWYSLPVKTLYQHLKYQESDTSKHEHQLECHKNVVSAEVTINLYKKDV